jgi:leucyl/phenylalanyl-tRNA--protein transferase
MPIFALSDALDFPDPALAHPSGVLAVGGDLRPERLLKAYGSGIFPWPCEGYPLMWHSPPERFVLAPAQLHVGRSMRKVLRRHPFEIRLDTSFHAVMLACAGTPRQGQDGTWITDDMIQGYTELHRQGHAHSAEAWLDGALVGGLYGVALGGVFFGESMFATVDDASKVTFATLVRQLQRWGFDLVDCQVHTPLFEAFGAQFVPREVFQRVLIQAVEKPGVPGPWQLDADLAHGTDG